VAAAQRTHIEFAVMYLDLDQFKSIHDRLGHDVGDQVLKIVATRLRDALRCIRTTPLIQATC
jgi:diguanylate cyclase (GGDEF)-like protein